ncbi:conjugal transfer protein [bacteria symbiont BFo1 of Frankliniella occidentalis]|uniref:type 4 pilus major pilin n=1 Tax=Erwinia TaxID=551 RepID=UPI000664646C|nr:MULTISPECIES: type 4 pilus major pilin [Erwinia]KMV67233.1 conjugal transfer protein [bacteria symbiont BFo1 of Frankliniella occidentalis]KYP82361.1 conjugal transfer protein [bacteria symbiont BFo1 of Frankliniella occidentalis]KYP86871.1 conjugal transfer protein [bacteria symbiont BFo1 of Frankliniella occidentalis]MDI3440250.1 type 4 pilus major pilin [Erwinia sp. V90_4]CAH0297518.1 hypothetical protein SRABI13_04269 [Erwinia aphidicola]
MKNMKRGIANITDFITSLGGALVMITIVLVGGILAYNKLFATTEVTLVSTLINETRQLRASNGYGTTDYSASLIAAGAVPSNVTVSGGKIYNRSGGVVTVKGNGVGFTVTDADLSAKDCIKLSQAIGTPDLASTKINNQSITGEVTAASATAACTADTNTVIFTTKS